MSRDMREPKRLIMHGASDFERRLLGAMREERPSPALRARMRRGLGFTGPLFWAASVKAMLGDLASKGGRAKLALGVTAGAVVVAGGIAAVQLATEAPVPAKPPVEVRVPAPEAPRATPSPAEPEAEPQVQVAESPSEPVAPAPSTAAPERDASSTLREEIAALDAVRAALEDGQKARALTLLEGYRTRFPDGVLSREANVLRLRAAKGRGRTGNTAPR